MILTRNKGQRMWGSGGSGSGGNGGGGGNSGVSAAWVEENYLSKEFFSQIFKIKATVTETVEGVTTTREIDLLPNAIADGTNTTLKNVKVEAGLWTEQFLSALGLNAGGGGGGVTLNEPLASINAAGLGTPTATGQVITWNGSQWIYSIPGGGGGGGTGTVTSITAGTGLSGGTITTMGTIALSTETQTNIGYGVTAYGWGDHAEAGYASSQSVSTLQGYFDSSGNAKSALKLTTVSKKAWGQTYWTAGGVPDNVEGNISAGNRGGVIEKFHAIELNNAGSLSSYGGLVDFHYNGSAADYTTRMIEEDAGVVSIYGKNSAATSGTYADKLVGVKVGSNVTGASYVQIGAVRIVYDHTNNALKIEKQDGTAANLYATGGVSALGMMATDSGILENLNLTGRLKFIDVENEHEHQIYGDTDGYLHIKAGEGIKLNSDLDANYVSGKRFYLGSTRYLYLDASNVLKYNDNGTIRTIAFA